MLYLTYFSFIPPPGPQYGTVERAWIAVMTEAEKVSELHQEVKNNLINEDFEKVKNWQKDSYHKQMMGGFKETKEADEGFKKAQKPWAKKLKEVRVYYIVIYINIVILVQPSRHGFRLRKLINLSWFYLQKFLNVHL